jgi:hypothetical protein
LERAVKEVLVSEHVQASLAQRLEVGVGGWVGRWVMRCPPVESMLREAKCLQMAVMRRFD